MNLDAIISECKQANDYETLIRAIPYARTIGMRCLRAGDEVIFTLPARKENIGNPTLPAIHGGVLGGFIEQSAIIRILMLLEKPNFPKVIDLSIDYLSAGHFQETYAECVVLRMGRRIANVSVSVWQTQKAKPIATARVHLLLD